MKKDVLDLICKDQPCNGCGYCLLKEMVLHDSKFDSRMLMQMDCVNRFKYDEGLRTKADPGWKEAWRMWVEQGYAKRFAELFHEDKKPLALYREITQK